MNRYDTGDQVRIEVTFAAEDGTPTDPTVVVVRYQRPGSGATALEYGEAESVARSGPGQYYVDVVADVAGVWAYRWEGTGALTAAAEGTFVVSRSAFS